MSSKPVKRPRRRAMRRWGTNAITVMRTATMMMMAFALVVMELKQSGWIPPSAAQTNGHGKGDVNEAGKDQAPTKPPPPTPDQKRPPCEAKYQIEAEGACWQRSTSKACDSGAGFRKDGKCYVPVLPDSGPPVSDP